MGLYFIPFIRWSNTFRNSAEFRWPFGCFYKFVANLICVARRKMHNVLNVGHIKNGLKEKPTHRDAQRKKDRAKREMSGKSIRKSAMR